MKNKYTVVVVGAGPSGLSTAINLKNLGIDDILVIEKSVFPRYKCCAGYIANKTKNAFMKLGLDIEESHYTLIKDFNIFYNYKLKQNIVNKFLYTNEKIDRVELDNSFFEVAKSQNIKVLENRYIIENDFDAKSVTLNDERTIEYEYLVFADGMSGYGSKFQEIKDKNIAMQVTFPSDLADQIQIHFGVTKKGYAWISSYNGIMNVGLTDVYDSNVNYRDIFVGFLKKFNLECNLKNIKGSFTPIGIGKPMLNENVFFVGDIVGACDPLTLSGLRYGLKCGEKCALAIKHKRNSIYKRYVKSLHFKFSMMSKLQNNFYKNKNMNLIFNVGCKYFKCLISLVFNNFFVNKK